MRHYDRASSNDLYIVQQLINDSVSLLVYSGGNSTAEQERGGGGEESDRSVRSGGGFNGMGAGAGGGGSYEGGGSGAGRRRGRGEGTMNGEKVLVGFLAHTKVRVMYCSRVIVGVGSGVSCVKDLFQDFCVYVYGQCGIWQVPRAALLCAYDNHLSACQRAF